ncbi:response regulator transcription factor [Lysobacter firmicutimachus]|uniref:Response regulator transcription factor n=1 Tax=Lysobacter firmicutimachus TaxID=1792846 RepID=A0AAU8MXU3_9GAMM
MRFIVADDHDSMRLLTFELLKKTFGVSSDHVTLVGTAEQLIEAASQPENASALVVLDLVMPGTIKRLRLLKELKRRAPFAAVVVYTGYDSPHLAQELLYQGVAGYVQKSSPLARLMEAVGEAMEQRRFIDPALDTANNLKIEWWNLTTRESDVVVALCKGWSAAKICEHYAIRPKTLSAHKRAAMAKLDISEEAGLAAYIIENGLDYLLDE